MRKLGLGLLGIALFTGGAWFASRRDAAPVAPAALPPSAVAPVSPAPVAAAERSAAPAEADVLAAPDAPEPPLPSYGIERALLPDLERYRAARDPAEREDALLTLALSDDPGVFEFLFAELRAAAPDARPQLLEAIVQYGDRRAIPELRERAAAANAPERAALLQAADFLALPSLTELRSGRWKPGDPPPQ